MSNEVDLSKVTIDEKVKQGMQTYMSNNNIMKEDWSETIVEITKTDSEFFALCHKGNAHLRTTNNREYNYSVWYEEAGDIILPAKQQGIAYSPSAGVLTIPNYSYIGSLVPDTIINYDANVNTTSWDMGAYYRVISIDKRGDKYEIGLAKIGTNGGDDASTESTPTSQEIETDLLGETGSQGRFVSIYYVSKEEGSDDAYPVFREVGTGKNWVTTLEHHTKITTHKASEGWRHSISPREWQIGKLGIYHARQIENSFMFGKGYFNPAQGRSATRGFFNHKNIQKRAVTRKEANFRRLIQFMEEDVAPYNHGIREFDTMTTPAGLSYVCELYDSLGAKSFFTFDASGRDNEMGIAIYNLRTPHGVLKLRVNRTLEQKFKKVPIFMLPRMEYCNARCLSGNGVSHATELKMNVHVPNANYFLDKFNSSYGFEMNGEKCHAVYKVVDDEVTNLG